MSKNQQHIQEKELVAKCLKHDRKAQEELYRLYARKMYAVCLGYAKNDEDANDIMQEGFIKVFRNLKSYDNTGPVGAWIRRIIINTAIDYYRKSLRAVETVELEHEMQGREFASEESLPGINFETFIELLRGLPEKARLVFNLFNLEGYTHQEIAEKLGISVGTSKSQYSRAKELLKAAIYKNDLM